jgi:hypothetical protein
MRASRIASWTFESVAAVFAAYSLCVLGWLLLQIARDVAGQTLHAPPGGMPGNLGAGIGIAIWAGSGVVAALLAFPIALAAQPDDKKAGAWRFGRVVQRASIVGFVTPIILFAVALALE